jgi:hypothetical protein
MPNGHVTRRRAAATTLVVAELVVAACGGDDEATDEGRGVHSTVRPPWATLDETAVN